MSEKATLELRGKKIELPLIEGTKQEVGLDISKLRAETGAVTLDIGYVNTGSCTSEITFLNGEEGVLKYRGIPIEQLCESSNFIEVSYLLINGKLPSKAELENFNSTIASYAEIKDDLKKILDSFPNEAHPMGVLSSATAALSGFYPQMCAENLSPDEMNKAICQLMARLKVIAAYFFRRSNNKEAVGSDPNLGYCADFINMMFSGPGYEVDHEVAKALNVLLILHADHEQNCSTATVRTVGSSKANVFASISSGINALWGPLHGGANQAVLEMLEEIQRNGGDPKWALEKSKDKSDPFRLMGFGHRVYKNFDPRARIIKKYCDVVLGKLGVDDPLLDIAKGLEQTALNDPYFVERKLYPNVDFYSGIIYRALGIPTNMFTVMFALGRLPGWLAQWKEMLETKGMKITRPRQVYTGKTDEHYVPLDQRG